MRTDVLYESDDPAIRYLDSTGGRTGYLPGIQIEVILVDGPLAGPQGLTIEMPMAGEPWPEAKWRDPDWRWLVYQFETMSQGLPSFPVYKLANGDEE